MKRRIGAGKEVGCDRRKLHGCWGVCDRTSQPYMDRYEEEGLLWLIDQCLEQVSQGKVPVSEGWPLIPACSPEARGRSERKFRTHQGWLPQELALAGTTDREAVYHPACNTEFMQPGLEEGSAFVLWIGGDLDDYLGETSERVVCKDRWLALAGTRHLAVTVIVNPDLAAAGLAGLGAKKGAARKDRPFFVCARHGRTLGGESPPVS